MHLEAAFSVLSYATVSQAYLSLLLFLLFFVSIFHRNSNIDTFHIVLFHQLSSRCHHTLLKATNEAHEGVVSNFHV